MANVIAVKIVVRNKSLVRLTISVLTSNVIFAIKSAISAIMTISLPQYRQIARENLHFCKQL
jgi:hypothetical protein